MVAARECSAHPADLGALISGESTSTACRPWRARSWPSAGLDGSRHSLLEHRLAPGPTKRGLRCGWRALPWPLDNGRTIPGDDAILRRLVSGDGATGVAVALRRLRAAGLRPPIQGACADPATSRLWAAALAFPVSHYWARRMARAFEPTNNG